MHIADQQTFIHPLYLGINNGGYGGPYHSPAGLHGVLQTPCSMPISAPVYNHLISGRSHSYRIKQVHFFFLNYCTLYTDQE